MATNKKAAKKKTARKKKIDRKGIGGRPTIFTEEVVKILEDCFQIGCKPGEAYSRASITRAAFYAKMKADKEFFHKMVKAKTEAVYQGRKSLMQLVKEKNVKAVEVFLKGKLPEEFGNKLELSGNSKKPLIPRKINVNIVRPKKRK